MAGEDYCNHRSAHHYEPEACVLLLHGERRSRFCTRTRIADRNATHACTPCALASANAESCASRMGTAPLGLPCGPEGRPARQLRSQLEATNDLTAVSCVSRQAQIRVALCSLERGATRLQRVPAVSRSLGTHVYRYVTAWSTGLTDARSVFEIAAAPCVHVAPGPQ